MGEKKMDASEMVGAYAKLCAKAASLWCRLPSSLKVRFRDVETGKMDMGDDEGLVDIEVINVLVWNEDRGSWHLARICINRSANVIDDYYTDPRLTESPIDLHPDEIFPVAIATFPGLLPFMPLLLSAEAFLRLAERNWRMSRQHRVLLKALDGQLPPELHERLKTAMTNSWLLRESAAR